MKLSFSFVFGATLLLSFACSHKQSAFDHSLQSAEDARRKKNFEAEREHFNRAVDEAESSNQQAEALYRRAHSYLREGQLEKGRDELILLADQYANSTRAARALLDAGRASEKLEQEQEASELYLRLLSQYPESGNAAAALKQAASLNSDTATQRISFYRQLLSKNKEPLLDEQLRFEIAEDLETVSPEQAIAAYEELARKHPLPQGSLTDDAIFRAAQLRNRAGDHQGALKSLQHLLKFDNKALLVGSYTRSTYFNAYLLLAEIQLFDLQDQQAAEKSYRSFIKKHPESRSLDDVLWQLALLKHQAQQDPCPEVHKLKKARPQSRFLQCASMICDDPELADATPQNCDASLLLTRHIVDN